MFFSTQLLFLSSSFSLQLRFIQALLEVWALMSAVVVLDVSDVTDWCNLYFSSSSACTVFMMFRHFYVIITCV